MAVYPRGDGFQAKFVVGGQLYREQFPTEEVAEKWEMDTRHAIKHGKPLPDAPARSVGGGDTGTIGQVLRSAEKEHWARLNAKTGGDQARFFVRWVGSNTPAHEALSEAKIGQFVTYLIDERNISTSTLNLYKANLSVLIKFAKVPAVDLKWEREEERQPRFLTEEEVAQIIQTLTIWDLLLERDFIIFLIDTGMRPFSEAGAFSWDQYWEGKVTLQKGGRRRGVEEIGGDGRGRSRRTKTGKSRTIPLTRRAIDAVERQRDLRTRGPFTSLTKSRMQYVWERLRMHHRQLDDTVLYTCRHTCASWQVIRGIDLRRVMEWMGHDSFKTTLIYANLAPRHLMDNLAVLETTSQPKLTIINGGA
nr:site-specific integrase [Mesorhizobium loti]